jgi:hypothetical protein
MNLEAKAKARERQWRKAKLENSVLGVCSIPPSQNIALIMRIRGDNWEIRTESLFATGC